MKLFYIKIYLHTLCNTDLQKDGILFEFQMLLIWMLLDVISKADFIIYIYIYIQLINRIQYTKYLITRKYTTLLWVCTSSLGCLPLSVYNCLLHWFKQNNLSIPTEPSGSNIALILLAHITQNTNNALLSVSSI